MMFSAYFVLIVLITFVRLFFIPLCVDLLLINNGTIQVNPNVDYGDVAKFYVGILVVLCIGLAVVLLAPCVGLIWCCCCCCGSNERQKRPRLLDDEDPSRKQGDHSRGPWLAPLVLSAITCIIL